MINIQWLASAHAHPIPTLRFLYPKICAQVSTSFLSTKTTRRAALFGSILTTTFSTPSPSTFSEPAVAATQLLELPNSGGVKAFDLRIGTGPTPLDGDQVAIHYYGRLAAKQGWRFDSTYDHKDDTGEPIPFVFVLGSSNVIPGIEAAVRSMKVGGIRRAVIPPSQGYQNTSQQPIPPNVLRVRDYLVLINPSSMTCFALSNFIENIPLRTIERKRWDIQEHFFDRQRLFTTIFNPTRLANGEGSTLGTLIFDIELVSLRHQ